MSVEIQVPCRTCLQEGEQMKDLFSETHVPRLDMMLLSSTQLEVNPLDGLPSFICINCTERLYNSYMFKKMCYQSDAILKKHSEKAFEEHNNEAEVKHNRNINCIITNNFTEVPIIDIPEEIKVEPPELQDVLDLEIDALQDDYGNEEPLHDDCGNEEPLYDDCRSEEHSENTEESSTEASSSQIVTEPPVKTIRRKKRYECSKCNAMFKNSILYQNHSCKDVGFLCTECNKSYTSLARLERHQRFVHDKDSNDSSDLPPLQSGFLQIKYELESSQMPNIKLKTQDKEYKDERENLNPNEENDQVKDRKPCPPGPSNEVKGTVSKKRSRPMNKKSIPKEEQLPCEHCGRSFGSKVFLLNHMYRAHGIGQRMFNCNPCGQMFTTKALYRVHRRKSHLAFNCHHCNKKFPFRSHFERHLRCVHDKKIKYICFKMQCRKSFPTQEALDHHKANDPHITERINYNKYFCDYCEEGFTAKYLLKRHIINLHMEPKIIKCDKCEMIFKTRRAKYSHARVHLPQKRCLCPECGKEFKKPDALDVHMARHRGDKKHKCQYCEKSFIRRADKTVHEKHHTNTKDFFCTECGRGFVRSCILRRHMLTHSGVKPYQCTYCDWRCSQTNDLKAHIRRHTGERFVCEICAKDFLQGYQLKNHKLSAHGILEPKNCSRVEKVAPPMEG